jgi:hypothetical protein
LDAWEVEIKKEERGKDNKKEKVRKRKIFRENVVKGKIVHFHRSGRREVGV